jgi:hypothetical protein
MSMEESSLLQKIMEQLSELIYLNGIIATELIKITENSAAIRRGEDFLNRSNCISEHDQLNKEIIKILRLKHEK